MIVRNCRGASRANQASSATTGSRPACFLLVVAVALALRIAHCWGQARNNPFFYAPTMDEEMHDTWARQIASGQGLGAVPFFRAPLYYYLVAGVYALFGPQIAMARLLGCALGAASCYLLAQLGQLLGGVRVGLYAGLLAAVYWPLIHFDAQLLTPALEIFLNLLMLLCLLHAGRKDDWRWFLLGGVAWGLSALTRPTILALAPGLVVWLWLGLRPGEEAQTAARRGAARRKAAALGLIVLGALLPILPVTLRNRIVGGEWVAIASYGGVNFYIGNNPQADGIAAIVPGTRPDWQGGFEDTHRIPEQELGRKLSAGEVSDYWFRKGLDWVRSDPLAWLRLTFFKLRLFWSPVEIPNNQPDWFFARLSEISVLYWVGFPIIATLGLAGLVLVSGQWRHWLLPLLFGLTNMAVVVAFFVPGRYRLPVVPILMLLAAAGLAKVPDLVRGRRLRSLAAYGGVAALAAVFLAGNPPDRAMHERETEGRGHLDLGLHYARQAMQQSGLRARAIEHLEKAVELRPKDWSARTSLGVWLLKFGQTEAAGRHLAQAVAQKPDDAEAHGYYADYLHARGQLEDAAQHYRTAAELNPVWPGPRTSLGYVLARLGRLEEAAAQFERALELAPGQANAWYQLAGLHLRRQRPADAVATLRRGLHAVPDDVRLLDTLAWLLATAADGSLHDGAEALRLAQRAAGLTGRKNADVLDTLAAAYARAGDFDQAVAVAEEALRLARAAGQNEAAARIQAHLEVFRRREAYQEQWSPRSAAKPPRPRAAREAVSRADGGAIGVTQTMSANRRCA